MLDAVEKVPGVALADAESEPGIIKCKGVDPTLGESVFRFLRPRTSIMELHASRHDGGSSVDFAVARKMLPNRQKFAPLLPEKRRPVARALIAQASGVVGMRRAGVGAAFTAGNDPAQRRD